MFSRNLPAVGWKISRKGMGEAESRHKTEMRSMRDYQRPQSELLPSPEWGGHIKQTSHRDRSCHRGRCSRAPQRKDSRAHRTVHAQFQLGGQEAHLGKGRARWLRQQLAWGYFIATLQSIFQIYNHINTKTRPFGVKHILWFFQLALISLLSVQMCENLQRVHR